MTEPQTLAKQIRALDLHIANDFNNGWNAALKRAAALADAAATTTPAKQDGDVRQAVPEWDYFQGLVNIARRSAAKAKIKFPQPNYVTLKIAEEAGEVVRGAVHYAEGRMEWDEVQGEIIQLLAMLIRFVTEGDEVNGVIPPELVRRVPPLIEPDPTPALGWRAMQTAAAKISDPHGAACNCGACDNGYMIAQAILALPGPTDAQALAEAVKLEAVRELVKAVKRLNDACDAMWNDHKRLEKNSGSFGQPYQIKELHIKAISEAQQALPDALAKIGEAK